GFDRHRPRVILSDKGSSRVTFDVACQYRARCLFVAVNQQVVPVPMPVTNDAVPCSGKRNVLRAEEWQPAEDRAIREELSPRGGSHSDSSSGRFLCFGFLRWDLGSISLAAGTMPTR